MNFLQDDLAYFEKGFEDNTKYWRRLGGKPNFRGKRVLDIGSGWGALCVDIATSGAEKVIGIDLVKSRVNFASKNVEVNYPELKSKITFLCCETTFLQNDGEFDIVVSKDTFEHVTDLPFVIKDAYRLLKPNGLLISGFGPLYYSYYGDHKATKAILPWFHLILPEKLLMDRVNKSRSSSLNRIRDLGLNQWKFKDYVRCFKNSPFKVVYFEINASEHLISKIFSIIRKVPFLTEYFTQNIYCILKK